MKTLKIKLEIAVPRIFSFVNSKRIQELSESKKDIASDIFVEMFEKLEINEALVLKSNLNDRLAVVRKLQKAIDTEEIEKVFEQHLKLHPWLINPYWDTLSENDIIPQKHLYENNLDKKGDLIGITDLLVYAKEEQYPVIVELKREKITNYSAPDVEEIINQIRRYRNGINSILKTQNKHVNNIKDIPAYFIIGSKSHEKLEITLNEIKDNNIKLLTYKHLIHIALNTYKTTLNANKSAIEDLDK